jgi:hypothetical protein
MKTGISQSGTTRTKPYGVDAAFMSLELHERGIHVVCRMPTIRLLRVIGAIEL